MPNEEPEGPDLPIKKLKNLNTIIPEKLLKKEDKYIELKGIIGAVAAGLILLSYVIYYYFYYNDGIKLNELYFISSGVGISVFTGLLFTFCRNIYVRTILLFTSIFYAMLEVIYITVWIIFGHPYAYIKTSLIIGLIIGIVYFIYDKFNNKSSDSN